MSAIAEGGVAVVTGAASGIGYALSEEALRRGMKVVVSDLREEALAEAAQKLTGQGADVLAVRADVTSEADIVALRDKALSKFGKVNLLVNNAGAFVGGLAWETSAAQMDWIVDLNFKSVAHGIRLFVPSMIEQGDPCHVITIASAAGISVYPGYASYSPTKHAALAITEALYLDLIAEQIGNVGVTIVMPGMVRTDIMNPEKSSPAQLGLDRDARHANATVRGIEVAVVLLLALGVSRLLPPTERHMFVVAAVWGLLTFLLVEVASGFLDTRQATLSTAARGGLGAFLYLEVLDASFSFDGVIGAFALSHNLFVIAAGLGIGAMYVRSLTIMLVERETLTQYRYLEHGAFYAIIALSVIMYVQALLPIPEVVTGLFGAALIGIALWSSVRWNRRNGPGC